MAELVEDQDGAPYPERWQPLLQGIRDLPEPTALDWLRGVWEQYGADSPLGEAAAVAYALRAG